MSDWSAVYLSERQSIEVAEAGIAVTIFAGFMAFGRFCGDWLKQRFGALVLARGSVMFALEVLGWGFFSSLAAVCVAPLFSSSPRNKAIMWLFIMYAIFSFLSVVGYATNIAFPIGTIAWGPILLALFILLSGYFRDLQKQAT